MKTTETVTPTSGNGKSASASEALRVVYRGRDIEDPRKEIPEVGFRDYWYPILPLSDIPRRRPKRVKMLGQDVCVFWGKTEPTVISDVCPHRGVSLAGGRCHYQGTVSCPYHGWTFDEDGECVAVLSEGPDSLMPGRASVYRYPTTVIKGVLFAWMGDRAPTEPKDDLPPEFFDASTLVSTNHRTWMTNWRQALENMNDNHVFYVHRNAVQVLLRGWPKTSFKTAKGVITGSGITLVPYSDGTAASRPYQEEYPGLGLWPKTRYRLLWTWLFKLRPLRWIATNAKGAYETDSHALFNRGSPELELEWNQGPNMPGMMRISFGDMLFTRWCVPVAERETRLFYFYTTRPSSKREELWTRTVKHHIVFKMLHDWNLGKQDGDILEEARYDMPETFSQFDLETVTWRKLAILSSRYGGRHDLIPADVLRQANGAG